ncbi:hypothetical protein P153DRAFT_52648 [Dothidotthia symphoricarpi CBS 119687]|uniref:Uncharacterized protein n=1 Tax=Dothidotthia symphoricarpi CBS 119687 TaxID=1392245 RepID=A0A6A6A9U7_9PLEO|nr:uncharacterized protein P153DRAFT_52648 [Dothidotthia symphoricarpi CBS 119687]KAF2127628.1 hypothetical protein P153DRAFT_52648 [Dothidotthia symphoricarpi CBS 119687]
MGSSPMDSKATSTTRVTTRMRRDRAPILPRIRLTKLLSSTVTAPLPKASTTRATTRTAVTLLTHRLRNTNNTHLNSSMGTVINSSMDTAVNNSTATAINNNNTYNTNNTNKGMASNNSTDMGISTSSRATVSSSMANRAHRAVLQRATAVLDPRSWEALAGLSSVASSVVERWAPLEDWSLALLARICWVTRKRTRRRSTRSTAVVRTRDHHMPVPLLDSVVCMREVAMGATRNIRAGATAGVVKALHRHRATRTERYVLKGMPAQYESFAMPLIGQPVLHKSFLRKRLLSV